MLGSSWLMYLLLCNVNSLVKTSDIRCHLSNMLSMERLIQYQFIRDDMKSTREMIFFIPSNAMPILIQNC